MAYISALSALTGSVVGGFTSGLMLRPPLQEVVAVCDGQPDAGAVLARSVERADEIMHSALDMFFGPNKTMREVHEVGKSGGRISIRSRNLASLYAPSCDRSRDCGAPRNSRQSLTPARSTPHAGPVA